MANLLLRFILAVPLLLALMLILAAGGQVYEPIYNATNTSGGGGLTGAEDAFGQDQTTTNEDTIGTFTVVAGIGLLLVVLGWVVFGDLTSDVNQGVQQRRLR